MAAFNYQAIDATGRDQKGVIEAESEKHARQLIREKGWTPLSLRSSFVNKTLKKTRSFSYKKNTLTNKELALFTRQFATLLAAGLPVESGLQAVGDQTEKDKTKGLVLAVRAKVVEGHSLHSALREHKESFSALYCSTVAAGEKSGHLDKVLLRLADYTEQQWHMRQKLKTALIYPVMIVCVAIGIVGFLLEYVVPKMVAVYGNLHQNLPTITELLIAMSNGVKSYGLLFLIMVIGLVVALRYGIQKNIKMREQMHHYLLRLPLFGYAFKTSDTARFARTLSILSASGVPLLEAMQIAAQLILIMPIRNAVEKAVQRVREGASLHHALKQTTYFPPMTIHMIASGEASGQVENMLERVAITEENEILRLIEVSLALFEPAIILLMGAIVLFIVLAVLLPIFQLNQFTG